MNTSIKRLCINPNDIALIEGKSIRQARNIYNDIKVRFKKEKHQSVSKKEYSLHSGLPLEEIEKYLI